MLFVAATSSGTDVAPGFDGEGWENDSQGLYGALRTIDEGDDRPMVVYFYTDWCGYCRQFEKELLGTVPVKRYLGEILAVRINPENGDQEQKIGQYYGVGGFPAFFVQGAKSRSMTKVERMRVENGQPRLLTPQEFIETVGLAAAK